ncbi:inositol polyphosphate kinase-domain-containing protein [Lobosporangium transversale]|uniref:Kinase n=1 Tax=Lobosporangium transversale TaxID=64571 RepID=A0A1Y2G9M5_9FUNG|nr:inositol polyphosphate kinase-domain-containing protein [Lobosporangium transversale]ORY99621.1 inositol polyphosphate kinase-domain-containing protein [Lobosporangium transversale]|eukprot:XP_021875916.1 inositol polyphosphate kinase-domain-containing protein [Lobosporangium transversale]
MGEENEIIVKPALPQELRFYEEAVLHPELQTWMPAYYGTLTLTHQQPQQSQTNGPTPTIKAMNGYPVSDMLSFKQQPDLAANEQSQELLHHLTREEGAEAFTKGDKEDAECLCLENVSHGFHKPCVLDLKLGTQLYDDDATEEKKQRLAKVSAETTSASLGFRLTGFQIYDNDKKEFIKYSKHYGKGLTNDTVLDGFRNFFAAKLGPQRMRLVIERFISDLTDILATLETQEVRMRSSSLLLMYEGEPDAFDEGLMMEQEKIANVVAKAKVHLDQTTNGSDNGQHDNGYQEMDIDEDSEYDEDDELAQKVTDLRLIDFAHSTWTPGHGPDEGVLLGVRSTLAQFEKLLTVDYPAEN